MTDRSRLAGPIAADVAHQLAEPLRALRDRLGLVVDQLERHVAMATGPTPYPWRSLQTLRQDLGATYLEVTALARKLDELDRALRDGGEPDWFELVPAVEVGLRLAGHHLDSEKGGMEVMIDLADTPPVRGVAGQLSLIVAQLVALSAESAHGLHNSTVSVQTKLAEDGYALISIIDNGAGSAEVGSLGDLVREVLTPWGGSIDAASEAGTGCAFELRLQLRAVAP